MKGTVFCCVCFKLFLPSILQRRDYVCCIVSSTTFGDLNVKEDSELEICLKEGQSVNYFLRFG